MANMISQSTIDAITKAGGAVLPVALRIREYLILGGLFNSELANHDAVRDLLIDAQATIDELRIEVEALKAKQIDVEAVMRLADDYENAGRRYLSASPRNAERIKGERDTAREALRASLLGDAIDAAVKA